MPTIGTYIPDDWEFASKFRNVIESQYRGKSGPYLRELIERDLLGLSIGSMQSAYTVAQLSEMLRAETALLRAERIARDYLLADDSKRTEIARELCTHLLDVTRRSPTYPETRDSGNALAAEGPGLPMG